MIGECPEPHLLRAVDWFDSQGIRRDIDKVYNFKHTLDGEAREWYPDYARQTDIIPLWKTLINDFSRYYSSQGRGEKNLHEAWRNMSFTPATDDVEIFLRDLQECAKQLNYDDQVIINTIRAAMPQEVYRTLYKMTDLSEVIDFCKNYYAKSPADRLKAQSAAKLEASPFKKMQEENPPDINTTLNRLTESLNKMDFTQKPYKPTLYPLEEAEVEAEEEGSKVGDPQGTNNLPTNPAEEEVVEVSEENPEVESLTKVPPRGFQERTPRPKM